MENITEQGASVSVIFNNYCLNAGVGDEWTM
jgi:hypothetical protein